MNDHEALLTPRALSRRLGVTPATLWRWSNEGKLSVVRTPGGHRRYVLPERCDSHADDVRRNIIYARVSSRKQARDLENQVRYLQERYPDHEVIRDVGSGVNFRRRGLSKVLELLHRGAVKQVVVAHRDRLARIGFDLIHSLIERSGAVLVDDSDSDPRRDSGEVSELTQDLVAIITHYAARIHGKRSYRGGGDGVKEDADSSKQGTERALREVLQCTTVLLQQVSRMDEKGDGGETR